MRTNIKLLWWLAGFFSILCPALAQTAPDLSSIGVGTHLYLRCNTTTWDVNDQSRLQPGSLNFLYELSFEVKEPGMTDAGDDCVLTETPELNAWGGWQKYYGGQVSSLKVPESTRLRTQTEPDESVNFKLRFPSLGRYRFTLNTRDGYFSVRKDGVLQAGDVKWTLPGTMMSDALDQLFLTSQYPYNSISLVDRVTGLPRWTYRADTYISFYGNCSSSDAAFVTMNGRVVALSVKTGQEIWSSDLNGALKDAYGYLSCYSKSDEVFLSYGSDRTTLVSLQKSTGKAQWSWTAEAYAGILGIDAGRVFLTSYKDTKSLLQTLDRVSGREVWQRNPGKGYFTVTEDGAVFLIDGSELRALAPDSGRTLWTYEGRQGDSIWLTFEQNGLFVHEKSRVASLDKRSGRTLWIYDYSSYAEQYPYAQILKSGVAVIRVNDHNANVSRQIALNSWTGKVVWEREDPTTAGYLSEDNHSGTWLISGKTIRALDPWTGQSRWSFTLKSEAPQENIMNVIEQDRSTVYVAYGHSGSKYPPMGVLALDVDTGKLKWQNWLESSLHRVGGDSSTLILNAGYYGSIKALKK